MSSFENQIIKNVEKSGKMSRIVSPHRFEISDSIYGQNDIQKMWDEPGYDKGKWPDSSHVLNIMSKNANIIDNFYQPLFDRMMKQYWDYACKNHDYKTYDELKNTVTCNISKFCENSKSLKSILFHPEANDKQMAQNYGAGIFVPCLPEYCIKLEKRHLLYIQLLNQTDHIYKVQFSDYVIKNKASSCISRWIIEYEYDSDTQTINWISQQCITYEEFLTSFVDDLNWSAQEKNFWYDMFDVGPSTCPTVIEIPLVLDQLYVLVPDNTDIIKMQPITIWHKSDADWLIREFQKYAHTDLKITDSGASVLLHQKQIHLDAVYEKCLTAIAIVNLQFVKNKINMISAEQTDTNITVGNMTVCTRTPFRTLLSI